MCIRGSFEPAERKGGVSKFLSDSPPLAHLGKRLDAVVKIKMTVRGGKRQIGRFIVSVTLKRD